MFIRARPWTFATWLEILRSIFCYSKHRIFSHRQQATMILFWCILRHMSSNFQKTVLASGLVSPQQWEYYLRLQKHQILSAQAKGEPVDEDKILRSILLEQRAITEYQASQLANGQTKFRLGPYVITDFIGQGGMGQVFTSYHSDQY